MRQPISLFKWIWNAYLRTALIPLVLVELVFVGIYFATNHWSQREMIGYLKKQVEFEMLQLANKEALIIQQQLLGISNAAELYRQQTAKALAATAVLDAEDAARLAYSPKGSYYTTRDRKNGGAAVFYSGFMPVRESERQKVARVLTTQQLMIDLKNSQPLAASLYLNTFDSLNVIYPYFEVLAQYPPRMNIPTFNFYYEADRAHNPERKIRWTEVYLDPAGHGWMASAVAPVYHENFLEGVIGIDVTVSTIVNRILKLKIPYGGYGVLVGKDGNILALPQSGEADWGLAELTDHHYDEAIKRDTFKPDPFNLYKRKGLVTFSRKVAGQTSGISSIGLQGKSQVASWATIAETGWKLLLIVPEKNVYGAVSRLSQKLFLIGSLMIAGLCFFYTIFFFVLAKKARKMSLSISQPLVEINGLVQRIGEGEYEQKELDLQVAELKSTAGFLVEMGHHLGMANHFLLATQEQLCKREADLQALVNSIDDIILEVAENGVLLNVWSNKQCKLSEPFMKGTGGSIDALFNRETAELLKEKIKQVIETEATVSLEYRFCYENECKWFQARLSLINQTTRTVVISARDITQRKEMEDSLIAAKEEAEKANRAKSRFLSGMSHELRTPLNGVLGFAQVLEMDPETPLTPLQNQSVQEIIKAGKHLLVLINEVLDLARIESGKLAISIEPVQIDSFVAESFSLMKPLADKLQVKLINRHSDCQKMFVLADRTRIKQVLLNLLSNAIKYNRENGEVAFWCEPIGEMIRFHVTDTGFGIAETELDLIFKPFQRLNQKNMIVEGTGIGLTVAKQLVGLMNGRIGVESQVGVGSHFWMELPPVNPVLTVAGELNFGAAIPGFEAEESSAYKILYIEDNPANLCLVERIISAYLPKVKIVSAASGELCLDLALAHKPDLILLDINLPGMDGYEVLRRLRENPETQKTVVVALSANVMPRDIEKGMAAGFNAYIAKPIDIPDFLQKVKGYLTEADRRCQEPPLVG